MIIAKELPPLELLRELFDYDPETGYLTWRVRVANRVRVGSRAGSKNIQGYRRVRVKDYGDFRESRIIYALYYSEPLSPQVEIDHINGIRDDNRICNLRKLNRSENAQNRAKPRNNKSGRPGVFYFEKRQKWIAWVKICQKRTHLGYFDTFDEAVAAREAAEKEHNLKVR